MILRYSIPRLSKLWDKNHKNLSAGWLRSDQTDRITPHRCGREMNARDRGGAKEMTMMMSMDDDDDEMSEWNCLVGIEIDRG